MERRERRYPAAILFPVAFDLTSKTLKTQGNGNGALRDANRVSTFCAVNNLTIGESINFTTQNDLLLIFSTLCVSFSHLRISVLCVI